MSPLPRVLILGSQGQLGRELQRSFAGSGDLILSRREGLDLASPDRVRDLIRQTSPDVILNAAAYTAVDRAESEPELAMAVNAEAPRILAQEASRADALLVHYSTDYVFDGSKATPWTEEDPPSPLNAYGAGKLAGEEAIRQIGRGYLIFRTSWVYGPHGKNFLLTMLRLGRERESLSVVNDQFGAPTTSIELADATRTIVGGILAQQYGASENWSGLYHMTCSGTTTWAGFAEAIFERAGALLQGRRPQVRPISSSEYPTRARRPRNSLLSNQRLHSRFGIRLRSWESALDAVIAQLSQGTG